MMQYNIYNHIHKHSYKFLKSNGLLSSQNYWLVLSVWSIGSLLSVFSLSHTRAHTHTHTHTDHVSFSFTFFCHFLSLLFCFSVFLSPFLFLTFSLSFSFSHILSHTFSLSFIPTLYFFLSFFPKNLLHCNLFCNMYFYPTYATDFIFITWGMLLFYDTTIHQTCYIETCFAICTFWNCAFVHLWFISIILSHAAW